MMQKMLEELDEYKKTHRFNFEAREFLAIMKKYDENAAITNPCMCDFRVTVDGQTIDISI